MANTDLMYSDTTVLQLQQREVLASKEEECPWCYRVDQV